MRRAPACLTFALVLTFLNAPAAADTWSVTVYAKGTYELWAGNHVPEDFYSLPTTGHFVYLGTGTGTRTFTYEKDGSDYIVYCVGGHSTFELDAVKFPGDAYISPYAGQSWEGNVQDPAAFTHTEDGIYTVVGYDCADCDDFTGFVAHALRDTICGDLNNDGRFDRDDAVIKYQDLMIEFRQFLIGCIFGCADCGGSKELR